MANRIEIVVDATDKSSDVMEKTAKKLVKKASEAGTEAGGKLSDQFADELKSGTREWEKVAEKGGEQAGRGMREEFEGEAKETDVKKELKRSLDEAEDTAKKSGGQAGKKLSDELETSAGKTKPAKKVKPALDEVEKDAKKAGDQGGRKLAEGVEDGARQGSGGVKGAFKNLGGDLSGVLSDAGQSGGTDMMSSLKDGIMGAKGGILGAVGAVGAAVGAVLAANISAEASRVGLQNRLGLSDADAAKFGKQAGRIYGQGWGESLDEVNATAAAVAQNLNMSVQDVNFAPIVTQAQQFSDIFGVDSVEAVRAVSQMMRTGLVDSAGEGFDALTRLYQEGGAMSDDFLETLNEYPTQFRNLGLSAEDAMNLMIQGLRGGARDSDVVADALKELRIRVMDLSAEEGLKKIGLDADQMAEAFARGGPQAREALDTILTRLQGVKDPAERARLAVELFGTQGEDMADALNALSLDPIRGELGNTSGALSNVATNAKNTMENDWSRFGRGLKQIFTNTGTAWKTLTTKEIPGSAMVSEEAMRNMKNKTGKNMGSMWGAFGTAAQGADNLTGSIKRVPNHKKTNLNARDNASGKVRGLKDEISGLKDKTVTITTWRREIFQQIGSMPLFGFAHGGIKGAAQSGGPRGDFTLVGEQGPELVKLAPGSMVKPAGETRQMLQQGDIVGMHGMAGGGISGAMQQILKQVQSGGNLFEDFSFRGDSALVGRFNDQITANFGKHLRRSNIKRPIFGEGANRGFSDRVLTNWLRSEIQSRQPSARPRKAPKKSGNTMQADGDELKIVLEIRSAGDPVANLLREVLQENIRQQYGGNVIAALGN